MLCSRASGREQAIAQHAPAPVCQMPLLQSIELADSFKQASRHTRLTTEGRLQLASCHRFGMLHP